MNNQPSSFVFVNTNTHALLSSMMIDNVRKLSERRVSNKSLTDGLGLDVKNKVLPDGINEYISPGQTLSFIPLSTIEK